MSQYGVSFVATVYAWDTAAGTVKTGDSPNITLYWTKDGTQSVTTNSCSEVSSTNAPGQYKVTLTATEAQCTAGTLGGKSSTSGIIIIPAQFTFEQYPTNFASLSVDGSGRVDVIKIAGTTQTARDIGASVIAASVTGNVGGNVVGSVGSVTAGVTLGVDAVDSTALAASAASEIAAAVQTSASATPLPANLKKINGTTVNGDGGATPWGP